MNKETGIESKIIGKGFKKACLNLGPQCNLDCEFCHRLTGVQLMSRKSLKRGIDNLHSHGVEKITFTGGEPFLYKDRLFYSLAYAKTLGVFTPGTFGYDFGEHISIAGIYDLEDTYLDIQANGAILLSANGETQIIGNILTDDLNDVIERYEFRLDRNRLQTQWVLNTIK